MDMLFATRTQSPIRQRHSTYSQFLGAACALWVGIACGCSAAGSSIGASGSQSGAAQGGIDASGGAAAGQSGLGQGSAGASSGLGDDAATSGSGQGGTGASDASLGSDNDGASGGGPADGSSSAQDAGPDRDTPIDAASDGQPSGKVSHRVLSSFSDRGILALLTKGGQIEWQYDVMTLGGEANDAWLLPSGNVVFAHVNGARELTPTKQVIWSYTAPVGSEVHSCQPLSNGNYLLGEAHNGGIGLLREVDATGAVRASTTGAPLSRTVGLIAGKRVQPTETPSANRAMGRRQRSPPCTAQPLF